MSEYKNITIVSDILHRCGRKKEEKDDGNKRLKKFGSMRD
jgi:hypothetical protein